MGDRHRLYRGFVRLYPGRFRRDYSDDLVQHFDDLVADRGARAAWARTSLDLTLTIPRYHLERIMNDQRSNIALNITIGVLATAGLASLMTDLYPGVIGMVLFVAAVALAVTQRSTLARALRVPDSRLRHRRLRIGAILAGVFVTSYVVYLATIGDSWTSTSTVLTIIGTLAMFGAIGFLVAGLLTPRTPDRDQLAGTG
jgi:hypothetical protein